MYSENHFSFHIPLNELSLDQDHILSAMGYDVNEQNNIPGQLYDTMDSLFDDLEIHTDIKAGYTIIPAGDVILEKTELKVGKKVFESGKIINGQLKKSNSIAIFLSSVGHDFDHWIKEFEAEGDTFKSYVADTIGSELAELAVDWLELKISEEISRLHYSHTNRFSPGYCDWPLMDQHKLFSFFPDNFLDIQLNSSALMTPRKSVSGIYGLGSNVKKQAYKCSICDSTDCYKRLHQLED